MKKLLMLSLVLLLGACRVAEEKKQVTIYPSAQIRTQNPTERKLYGKWQHEDLIKIYEYDEEYGQRLTCDSLDIYNQRSFSIEENMYGENKHIIKLYSDDDNVIISSYVELLDNDTYIYKLLKVDPNTPTNEWVTIDVPLTYKRIK